MNLYFNFHIEPYDQGKRIATPATRSQRSLECHAFVAHQYVHNDRLEPSACASKAVHKTCHLLPGRVISVGPYGRGNAAARAKRSLPRKVGQSGIDMQPDMYSPGYPRETSVDNDGLIRVSALFFLTPGAAHSFFSARRKERMGGALRRLRCANMYSTPRLYSYPIAKRKTFFAVSPLM